jgi:AcrR family transcriptional regulator
METQTDTRESLLEAAEELFSEHGIQASSVRAITQHAGANLAAVNYHFGSKDGLVRAVFARRLKPMSEERLRELDGCDLSAPDAVEQVLVAFLKPVLRMAKETPEGARGFARLMGRAFSEPNEEVRQAILGELSESIHRFLAAFSQLLPHLPQDELIWRFHFVGGAMGHTVACGHLLERSLEGRCHIGDTGEVLQRMVPFLAAGMRAPAGTQEALIKETT